MTTSEMMTQLIRVDRPNRLHAFIYLPVKTDRQYWELLSFVYTDSEGFGSFNKSFLKSMLTSKRPKREFMMNAKERATLKKMPDTLTVYRGYDDPRAQKGWAWTVDRERAEWFARRWSSTTPYLATGVCNKADVIAYLNERQEQEILIDPKLVKKVAVDLLGKKRKKVSSVA